MHYNAETEVTGCLTDVQYGFVSLRSLHYLAAPLCVHQGTLGQLSMHLESYRPALIKNEELEANVVPITALKGVGQVDGQTPLTCVLSSSTTALLRGSLSGSRALVSELLPSTDGEE